MWASHFGHVEVMKLLMAAGADIQAQNDVSRAHILVLKIIVTPNYVVE
jgi:ankyrin repeat protein